MKGRDAVRASEDGRSPCSLALLKARELQTEPGEIVQVERKRKT